MEYGRHMTFYSGLGDLLVTDSDSPFSRCQVGQAVE